MSTPPQPAPDFTSKQSLRGITPGQRRVRGRGALATYRELAVGTDGWGSLAAYEAYTLLLSNLSGLVGFAARSLALPLLLGSCGARPAIGRGVVIRRPSDIRLGNGVIVDDYVTLDVRSMEHQQTEPAILLGDNTFIGRHSMIAAKGGVISLGPGSNVSSYCRIATESSVTIGASVLIAAYAYIGPGNHQRDEAGRTLIEAATEKRGGVEIGDHAWIGARATILDGVKIGANAIVGAHSLVREDVPEGTVVAGSPAKILHRGASAAADNLRS